MKHLDNSFTRIKLALFLIFLFSSCSNNESTSNLKKDEVDVYVAGIINSNGYIIPKYWKNDQPVNIEINQTNGAAFVSDIKVVNNDVYIVGSESSSTKRDIVYWKNGIRKLVYSGSTSEVNGYKIFIDNNDVYVFGKDDSKKIKYWKNEEPAVELFDGNSNPENPTFFVENNTIHTTAGILNSDNTTTYKYYKNNKFERNFEKNSSIQSIYVKNDVLYACGFIADAMDVNKTKCFYWKNDVATELPSEENSEKGFCSDISINEFNDVFVTGSITTSGYRETYNCYWKNGKVTKLSILPQSIATYKNDLYISSIKYDELKGNFAQYQKNDQSTSLELVWPNSFTVIAVVKRI